MIKYKKVKRVLSVRKSIICDKCGAEYDYDTVPGIFEEQEFLKINFTGGFNSVFGDMNHIECDLCQRCLIEMIEPYVRITR